MNNPHPHPPPGALPQYAPAPPYEPSPRRDAVSTMSLVFAVTAPSGLVVTAYPAMLAALLTYPDEGPSDRPWIAALVFWSLPLLFGLISVVLAFVSLKGAAARSPSRASAVAALCINAAIFILGMIFTMPYLRYWLFG